MLVCFFDSEGCGWQDEGTDECVAYALDWGVVLDWNLEEVEGLVVESRVRSVSQLANIACE